MLLLILCFIACNATNKSISDNSNNKMEKENTQKEGFTKGLIVYSDKEDDCPFTIEVKTDNNIIYYDPINLEDIYKNNGEKVWFKFSGLRRMNRCEKASPINIIEIEKRED